MSSSRDRQTVSINLDRLKARMEAVNAFGADAQGRGVHRLSFSDADMGARRWLQGEMARLGLATRMDAVGNVIGRWETGEGPAVMLGSHLDSVPRGGKLDGALGVVAALECVQAAMEAGCAPASPIEVVGTSEEEGRFGGMLGAQAITGGVDPLWLAEAVNDEGEKLTDAMRAAGFDHGDYKSAARDPKEIKAFLELHIEQGPVLDRSGKQVGLVEGISGVFNWAVTFSGEANHAGTTPMDLRRDAFAGLADFAAAIPGVLEEVGTAASRLTVGKVDLFPNFAHTVPGRCEFVIIGRDMEESVMKALAQACRTRLDAAASRHDLEMSLHEASWLAPTPCDPKIMAAFSRQAELLGLDATVLPSGAGHDTQMMAGFTKAGMIFVPSAGGVSHAPEEFTEWPDIEAGSNLLLHTMLEVAGAAS
jgi:hydantoinase/carbamoylase family amidase